MGQHVMISTFQEYYRLVEYFSRFAIKNLRIVIGIPTFIKVINEKYYKNLKGGILEAFGKIFMDNVKVYVYPTTPAVELKSRKPVGELLTSKDVRLPEDHEGLYYYLFKNRKIIDIEHVKKEWLYINSANVLKMIREGDPGWEEMVPNYVEKEVKEKGLFGYKQAEKRKSGKADE